MKHYKNCQSCGIPLSSDLQRGGTNQDGSKSNKYCSFCFENGKFKQADIDVLQMQDVVKYKMKELGFPGFLAGLFTKRIPKLERWNNRSKE
jgi:hypothetical protein